MSVREDEVREKHTWSAVNGGTLLHHSYFVKDLKLRLQWLQGPSKLSYDGKLMPFTAHTKIGYYNAEDSYRLRFKKYVDHLISVSIHAIDI